MVSCSHPHHRHKILCNRTYARDLGICWNLTQPSGEIGSFEGREVLHVLVGDINLRAWSNDLGSVDDLMDFIHAAIVDAYLLGLRSDLV